MKRIRADLDPQNFNVTLRFKITIQTRYGTYESGTLSHFCLLYNPF